MERNMREGLFGVRGNLGTSKSVAWSSKPLNEPLNDGSVVCVEGVKKGLKQVPRATVNDTILASIAAALGDFINTPTKDNADRPVFLTAVLPVNLRPLLALLTGSIPDIDAPLSEKIKMLQGNKIGGLIFDLPLDMTTSTDNSKMVEMVKETRKRTAWCKMLPESLVAFLMANVSSLMTVRLQKDMQFHSIGQADLAVSNVKGPDEMVHVCGLPVEQLVGFLPPPNGCPLGVAVTTYRGCLQISVNMDEKAVQSLLSNSSLVSQHDMKASTGAQIVLSKVERKLHDFSK
jgi:hypothetical protein